MATEALISGTERHFREIGNWAEAVDHSRLDLVGAVQNYHGAALGRFAAAVVDNSFRVMRERAAMLVHRIDGQPHRDCVSDDVHCRLDVALRMLREPAAALVAADNDATVNDATDKLLYACDAFATEGRQFIQLWAAEFHRYQQQHGSARELVSGQPESLSDNAHKLLSLLLKHHQYDQAGVGVALPIAVQEAARKLEINAGSISRAFRELFPGKDDLRGHDFYKLICQKSETAIFTALRGLCGEFASRISIDSIPIR